MIGIAAWLIAAQFALADEKLFNVPIKEINPDWCSANVFPGAPKNNRSYSISGRYYGIEPITVSVGSYTTCDQKRGTFLLALTAPDADDGSTAKVKKHRHFPKIMALQEFDKELKPTLSKFQGHRFLFFDCDDCKDASLYKISGYPYKFVAEDKLDEKQVVDGTVNPYFIECEEALKLSEFGPLKNYLEQNENRIPESCFRMNRNEYLFLDSNTMGGLVYWNAETNETSNEFNPPYISIQREITGKANKRFVLIVTDYARHGESGATYLVFHLVPKTKDNHSYKLDNLISSHENPESGLCGDWNNAQSSNLYQPYLSTINKATSIDSYKVLNDGTADLKISFNITEQDCKTLDKTHFVKTFNIGDGSFMEVKEPNK